MNSTVQNWTQTWATHNNLPVSFAESTPSTSTWAKEDYTGPSPALYLADVQTHGRGRHTNSWASRAGEGLLSTWCFELRTPPPVVFPIRIGWSIYKALKTAWPETPFALKAPNDIYIDDNKIAGVLVEVVSSANLHIFIGLGLNVWGAPQSLDRPTTSLQNHASVTEEHWTRFCDTLYNGFNASILKQDSELTSAECLHINQALTSYYGAKFTKIQPNGSLIFSDGTITFWRDL